MEPHPAVPEAKAAGGCSTRSRGPPALEPPSTRKAPKRQVGMGPCLGWQVNPLLASLTSPVALKQQLWGSET